MLLLVDDGFVHRPISNVCDWILWNLYDLVHILLYYFFEANTLKWPNVLLVSIGISCRQIEQKHDLKFEKLSHKQRQNQLIREFWTIVQIFSLLLLLLLFAWILMNTFIYYISRVDLVFYWHWFCCEWEKDSLWMRHENPNQNEFSSVSDSMKCELFKQSNKHIIWYIKFSICMWCGS